MATTIERNADGRWVPAEPIGMRGLLGRTETALRWMADHAHTKGHQFADFVGRLDERRLGR